MAEFKLYPIRPEGEAPLWVLASEAEILDYHEASPNNCQHPQTELRDYRTSNGGWQRKDQCLICGSSASQAKPRDKNSSVPEWDARLSTLWETQCNARRRKIEDMLIERTANWETEGYPLYEDYLKSDAWKRKRSLVLARDKQTCQSCLEQPATEVHHLTYDQIFEEYLFDLVSVCRKCHERLHSKKIAAIGAAKAKGLMIGK